MKLEKKRSFFERKGKNDTITNMELTKAYEPKKVEDRIYQFWLRAGFFDPDKLPGKRKKPYVIMIAPPNVTGSLHMGHALENTISDILIRFHRLRDIKRCGCPARTTPASPPRMSLKKN